MDPRLQPGARTALHRESVRVHQQLARAAAAGRKAQARRWRKKEARQRTFRAAALGARPRDQAVAGDDAGRALRRDRDSHAEAARRLPHARAVHGPRPLAQPGVREAACGAKAAMDRAVLEGAGNGGRPRAAVRGRGTGDRMSDGLNRKELLAEIRRLNRLLTVAARKAAAQYSVIDKLTAANLRVQALLKRLEGRRGN